MQTMIQVPRCRRIVSAFAFGALCLAQLAASRDATAATACIADANGLTAALNYLETHEQVTTINLEQGLYDVGAWDRTFLAQIQIVGGFKPGTLCAQHEDDASKTIIDFGGGDVLLRQKRGSPTALITLSDLTLRDGGELEIFTGDPAVPPYFGQHAYPGQVGLNRVRVTGFSYVVLTNYYGGTRLTDVLFDHLGGGGCAVNVQHYQASTFVFDHVTADLTGTSDFCLDDDSYEEDSDFTIANSVFWSSDGKQTAIRGLDGAGSGKTNHVTLDHVLFKSFAGVAGDVNIQKQISADPQWVNPAGGDYRLKIPPQTLSPAINAGATVANVPEPFTDIAGFPRKIGSNTDLGAFESTYNDASSFTVTNTSDCSTPGCGSLRDAITLANGSAAAAATIGFNIAGGCPAAINIASPLPDVVKPITIDGYTQPNSAVNTDPIAFNAKLCIVVQPSGGVSFALRVPGNSNGSLNVRGIGFGAFAVPVELFGGSNHQVAGNQFGGYINNYGYQLFGSSTSGIYMGAPTGQLTVGGADPASRNVFLNVYSYTATPAAAISVGSPVNGVSGACQIIGNTFGIQDDGSFASKNLNYGIELQGNGCLVKDNIIVGVTRDAIVIDGALGGGQHNVVRNNTIGLAPRGGSSGQNDGAGVRVSGVHNVIGSSTSGASLADANVIWNMDGGGVIVSGQDAYGNTIRANYIQDNGPAHAGMSIDLGADGPTINDFADADTGPNNRQNFPTLHGISWPSKPGIGTTNQSVVLSGMLRTFPGYYQIDVYYSDGCDASGKGIAQQWIGSNEGVYLPAQTYYVPFQVQAQVPVYVPGYGALSVTATNAGGEDSTSEMSTCLPIDTIFRDGQEGSLGLD
jgi:hypothetical protein